MSMDRFTEKKKKREWKSNDESRRDGVSRTVTSSDPFVDPYKTFLVEGVEKVG